MTTRPRELVLFPLAWRPLNVSVHVESLFAGIVVGNLDELVEPVLPGSIRNACAEPTGQLGVEGFRQPSYSNVPQLKGG